MWKRLLICILFLLNLACILYFWYAGNSSYLNDSLADILTALGRLSGLLAVYTVLLQFIFLGREVWLEQLIGLDKLTKIHHINAQTAITFIICHPLLIITGYALQSGKPFIRQFTELLFNTDDVLKAFIAVILFIIVVVLSLTIVKKRLKYETWYLVHTSTYLAVLLAFGHQQLLGQEFNRSAYFSLYWSLLYVFVFSNFFIYRFLRPVYFFIKHRFLLAENIKETDNVRSLYISGKNLKEYPIKPGQFMIIRFLDNNNFWKPHPFSLSNLPDNHALRISVKSSGDFTSQIYKIRKNTRVLIDGPYGTFTLPENNKKILFIAGGIGITPVRSMLEQAVYKKYDPILLYSNRYEKEIVFKKELDLLSRQYRFPIYYFVTEDPESGLHKGRITDNQITRLVKDLKEREIYICGPQKMMAGLVSQLIKLRIPRKQIHFEQFQL